MEAKGIVRLPHVRGLGREVAGVATTFVKLFITFILYFFY